MVNVLIGYSGFIGSYLNSKFPTKFQVRLNSSSISDVTMDKINELVIAAPSGSKYLVNKNSSEDLASINQIVAFVKIQCNYRIVFFIIFKNKYMLKTFNTTYFP